MSLRRLAFPVRFPLQSDSTNRMMQFNPSCFEGDHEPVPLVDFAPSAVGQFVAVADHDLMREVLGTVVASWPDRGPTWAIRLHGTSDPVIIYCYETASSKLGRWIVTRIVPSTWEERYRALVAARKTFDPTRFGLVNPAAVGEGKFDSEHIGPWTMWAHDPSADVMVVGQDWGDVNHFRKTAGLDKPNLVTNTALRELLAGIGRPIPPPPSEAPLDAEERSTCGVWLTNALLWLKESGLSSAMKPEWFDHTTKVLLQEQIALVQPRVVVALGRLAYDAILSAYDLPPHAGAFLRAVEDQRGTEVPNGPSSFTLLAVYHCGARIRNTVRPYDAQVRDWARVRSALPFIKLMENGAKVGACAEPV